MVTIAPCAHAEVERAVFGRLRKIADILADLLRLPQLSSAAATQLSRLAIGAYKALTAGAKLHVGAKGACHIPVHVQESPCMHGMGGNIKTWQRLTFRM
jgi:hypothetical protein